MTLCIDILYNEHYTLHARNVNLSKLYNICVLKVMNTAEYSSINLIRYEHYVENINNTIIHSIVSC